MSIFKLPKSPLYRGLARIFILVAVVWTGLILFWIRDERFDMVQPDIKTAERVDDWLAEIGMLNRSDSEKFDNLPAARRSLIQKAADTGAYYINGREQKLTASELEGYKAILESGFSKQVNDTLAEVCDSSHIEGIKSLCNLNYVHQPPLWDFRGVSYLDLDTLSFYVQRVIHQLNEIQIYEDGEYRFTGKYTGLVTENDLSLLDDLKTAQKNRWILKPLFWFAAWIVPLLGLGLATVIVIEICRWIVRGFRPSAQSNP